MTASERESIAITVPKLPYLRWRTFGGDRTSGLPCVADLPNRLLVSSGRVATAVALRLAGAGVGTKVLVPSYHCPTMVAAVVATGAKPVFYPIAHDGSPSLDFLDALILDDVCAMVAVHYFGLPVALTGVRALCDRRGIALIEDCAHSMFGIVDGSAVGTTGDYAIASLTKFFPVVDGGIIARNAIVRRESNPTLTLRWQPRRAGAEIRSLANALELGVAQHGFPGLNSVLSALFGLRKIMSNERRPTGSDVPPPGLRESTPIQWLADFSGMESGVWQASLASAWVGRHANRARIVERRRENYARLLDLTANLSGARPLFAALPPTAAPYVFPLYVDEPEAIYQDVRQAGIPVYRWDELWPGVPVTSGDYGLDWATHVFQLGCHQDLNGTHVKLMAEALQAILARRRR